MRVGIIGAGNVATVMGKLLIRSNHEVIQVMSRNIEHAALLARKLNCDFGDMKTIVNPSADLYIIAIADGAFQEIRNIDFHNKLTVHTAGSVSIDVLREITGHYGVLYPLQSLRKEMDVIPQIPFLIDGNNEHVLKFIEDFAHSISPVVRKANDEQRFRLHTAAVIVNNFTNHLYMLAEDFCIKEHVDFQLLQPLIIETAARLSEISPAMVQTGPAVRKDIQTLDKHLKLLNDYPKLRTLYLKLTESIINA